MLTRFSVVYFVYPETCGVRLEDMDSLFGDASTHFPFYNPSPSTVTPTSDEDLHYRLRTTVIPQLYSRVAPAATHLKRRLDPNNVSTLYFEGTLDGRPNWRVCQIGEDDVHEHLIVGTTRLSKNWHPESLPKTRGAKSAVDIDATTLQTLDRLAWRCVEKGTGWGIVWAPQNVALCRICVISTGVSTSGLSSPRPLGVKYKLLQHGDKDWRTQLGATLGI